MCLGSEKRAARISHKDYVERIGLPREEMAKLQEQLERMCLAEQEEKERVQEAWAAEGLTWELVDRYIERADKKLVLT